MGVTKAPTRRGGKTPGDPQNGGRGGGNQVQGSDHGEEQREREGKNRPKVGGLQQTGTKRPNARRRNWGDESGRKSAELEEVPEPQWWEVIKK